MSRATQDTTGPQDGSRKGLSPAMAALSNAFRSRTVCRDVVLQPPCGVATARVWAAPRSLATTGGIIVIFFSCGY